MTYLEDTMCTQIQSIVRMRHSRIDYIRQQAAVVKVQRAWRHMCKKRLSCRIVAATRLQRYVLGE